MRLLLDTHTLIWMATDPGSLSKPAAEALVAPTNDLFVSAVSGWEISIKRSRGRLVSPDVDAEMLARLRVIELPITFEHASAIGQLPDVHRDPFDRMLIAQALVERLVVVSRDRVFDGYPVETLW
ncbi:MAG: type II toxin-antitoxin system VapC family toxin [Microthrixaceae bacterium]